jgi:hypothetical protein
MMRWGRGRLNRSPAVTRESQSRASIRGILIIAEKKFCPLSSPPTTRGSLRGKLFEDGSQAENQYEAVLIGNQKEKSVYLTNGEKR